MQSTVPVARPGVLYPYAQWYFFAAIVTTWVGFSQTYFLRLKQNDLLHHLHGATAGLWIALLIVEPILYQRGKLALHRKLGRWGVYGLVPCLLVMGALMIHAMLRNHKDYPPGATYVLASLDAYSLVLFPLFVVLAVYYGRQIELHARYMALTVLALIPPALGRALFFVPWEDSFAKTLNTSYLLIMFVLVLLIFDDRRKGRVRAPYVVGLLSSIPLLLATNFAGSWKGWHRLADWYASL